MVSTPRRQHPRWLHGLSSRFARASPHGEVEALAITLLGSSPRDPTVMAAARGAAQEILFVERVQKLRRVSEESDLLLRLPDFSAYQEEYAQLAAAVKDQPAGECSDTRLELMKARLEAGDQDTDHSREALQAILRSISAGPADVRRLWEYERRAVSRRTRALRLLDYERVEAERRERPAAGCGRP